MVMPADRAAESTRPRIAVVHEWVAAYAGSEQVFEALARLYPSADLYALSRTPGVNLAVGERVISTTFLDRPQFRDRRQLTLPLMPLAWRALGSRDYDIVLTSHHAFAHSNHLAGSGVHLCYVHSPARYLWAPEIDGRGGSRVLRPAKAILRAVDRRAAKRVKAFAANSTAVAQRITDSWGRGAEVIHPPVRVGYFQNDRPSDAPPTRSYILGVGRWIPYKNLHLVVEVADKLDLPVKIAGRGPDASKIRAAAQAARVPVDVIESPSDADLRDLYRNAACLVFPTSEDFGIVPVEAQAAGTPVVAPREGGAIDTVRSGVSGVLVDELSVDALAAGVQAAIGLDPLGCVESATRFSPDVFARRIVDFVGRHGGSA